MIFERKPLSYFLCELEPFIDCETMQEHFDVHYKKYTDKLNEALSEDGMLHDGKESDIIDILKNYQNLPVAIRNNGGGYYNHLLYFDNISPRNNSYHHYASDELKEKMQIFGTYENFYEHFVKAGTNLFGSGWVWLIEHNDRLKLVTTANQDNPVMSLDCKVLLGMDVWEHAYYLKHKADRKSYIESFFQTIDWQVVSSRI